MILLKHQFLKHKTSDCVTTQKKDTSSYRTAHAANSIWGRVAKMRYPVFTARSAVKHKVKMAFMPFFLLILDSRLRGNDGLAPVLYGMTDLFKQLRFKA